MAEAKTNALRILEQAGAKFETRTYDPDIPDGVGVARTLGEDVESVFKTLVTYSEQSLENYVFVIPVSCTLDLKKAAKAVGEKSVHMILEKKLLPLTGYVHGGCSPVGMKKTLRTVIDESAILFDTIFISGGRRGLQIEISLEELGKVVPFTLADIAIQSVY